ncbi:MAG TPA: FAD-dependent oxidoreductase [Thermoanaerobaculia bacterium]
MPTAGIVIAGAGVIGCSIAWHLASRGVRDVLVVDRAATFGGGSTPKATGGFREQFGTAINVRLSLLSREKLLRFNDELGADPGYEPRGYLFFCTSERDLQEMRDAQRIQHECGATETRMLDRQEALALNAAVRDEAIAGAAFGPHDGFIKPMNILRGYADAAARLGVRFEFGGDVKPSDPGITYVNAGGAWAGEICDVPVTALRRRVACTVPTNILPAEMPMTIWASDGFHTRVRDGRVLLLRPDDPPDDDRWLPDLIESAHERIPALRDVPIDEGACWSGLYEMSPDRHAILGRHPRLENVILANGSSGHGVMHAPAIGQLIAELIVDGRTSIDITPLRASRFAEGDAIRGPALL